jgi:hypothetical protein
VLFAVPALGPSWGNGCPNGDTEPMTTRSNSSGSSNYLSRRLASAGMGLLRCSGHMRHRGW